MNRLAPLLAALALSLGACMPTVDLSEYDDDVTDVDGDPVFPDSDQPSDSDMGDDTSTPPVVAIPVPSPSTYWTFDGAERTATTAIDRIGDREIELPTHTAELGRVLVPWGDAVGRFEDKAFSGDMTFVWYGAVNPPKAAVVQPILSVDKGEVFDLSIYHGAVHEIVVGHAGEEHWFVVPGGAHLFAVVRDTAAHSYHYFVDGAFAGSAPITALPTSTSASAVLTIGGVMDDMAVFNGALDAEQIGELWKRVNLGLDHTVAVEQAPFDRPSLLPNR